MSFSADQVFQNNYSACFNVPTTSAQSVQEQISHATDRLNAAQKDRYAKIGILSMFWESDDTGGIQDCELFIQTIIKPQDTTESILIPLKDNAKPLSLLNDVTTFLMQLLKGITESGKALFVFHYAGHGWGCGDSLHLCSKIQDPGSRSVEGPSLVFDLLKASLKAAATDYPVDVLFLMDCCCAGVGGRGRQLIKGGRVEFMAATTDRGLSNSRQDGQTFTQAWCEAFDVLLAKKIPFTTEDIKSVMEHDRDLAQYPRVVTLLEGVNLPILFRPEHSRAAATPPIVKWVICAFHLKEEPDHPRMRELVKFLETSQVPISILSLVPSSSSYLLLRMPAALQDFLEFVPFLSFTD